jgi:hypothetical protein
MQRDMDIVRQVLIAVEHATEPVESLPDCDDSVFSYHVALLMEAGLVLGDVSQGPDMQPMAGMIFRLTWPGHDFLDAARDDTVWRTAREKILKPGASWTFDLLKATLRALAAQQLAKLGLPIHE